MRTGFYFDCEDGCLWLVHPNGSAEFFSDVTGDWMVFEGTRHALSTWLRSTTIGYIGL